MECFRCGENMKESSGCIHDRTITFADGEEATPIANEATYAPSCHDCGAVEGEYHHPGCDMEECPRCGGQYFICDCVTEEKKALWGEA